MDSFIIDSYDKFLELKEYVSENTFPLVALDLETDSVEEHKANIYGIGLAFSPDEAFYLPIRTKDGPSFFTTIQENLIFDWVSSVCSSKKLIGHNIIYDVLVYRYHCGVDLTPFIYADTILMHHMIDEEPPHGLKEVAVKYLGSWADKAQKALYESIVANGGSITKSNMQMYKADTEVLGTYCNWDVLLTMKLYNMFLQRMEKEGLLKFFFEEETMPLYREVTIPMKWNGITVDVAHFEQTKIEITYKLKELEGELYNEIKELVASFETELLEEQFPEKRSGNYPKAAASLLGLELGSLSKKSLEYNLKNTLLDVDQTNLIDWVLQSREVCPVPKRRVQEYLFFNKFDRKYIFNFQSKDHLKWLFIEVLKEKPLDKTEGGEPKIDDAFLSSLEERHPWVKILRDINTLHKIEGTYIDGLVNRVYDGKLYASMLQFGTTSGRYASRNPNLQNLSAPQFTNTEGMTLKQAKHTQEMDKFNNSARKGMIAKPGYKFIGCDYNSLEPHVAAYASGDGGLIDIFVTGKDFYSQIACKQFKLDHLSPYKEDDNYLGKLDKKKRDMTKTYSLAALYGAESGRISQVLNNTREEAQELLDGYLNAFPGIKTFITQCHNDAKFKGMSVTKLGRIRHLDECKILHRTYGDDLKDYVWARRKGLLDERRAYKNSLNLSVNHRIQGLAASIINRAMIMMAREFKRLLIDAIILLSIHDEVIIEVKENQVEEASKVIKYCMENAVDLNPIKLKATPIIGDSYLDCK